jgi:hypothetical protein
VPVHQFRDQVTNNEGIVLSGTFNGQVYINASGKTLTSIDWFNHFPGTLLFLSIQGTSDAYEVYSGPIAGTVMERV